MRNVLLLVLITASSVVLTQTFIKNQESKAECTELGGMIVISRESTICIPKDVKILRKYESMDVYSLKI